MAVKSQILELSSRIDRDSLHCPNCNVAYSDRDLTTHLEEQEWKEIRQVRLEAKVEKKRSELQRQFDGRLRSKVQELEQQYGSAKAVLRAKSNEIAQQIRSTILNLSCPHCHKVYFDFTGCMALVCERCKGNFCGF